MKKIPGLRTSAYFCDLKFIFRLYPHAYKQTSPLDVIYPHAKVSSFLSSGHCLLAPTLKVAKSLRCSHSLEADRQGTFLSLPEPLTRFVTLL